MLQMLQELTVAMSRIAIVVLVNFFNCNLLN